MNRRERLPNWTREETKIMLEWFGKRENRTTYNRKSNRADDDDQYHYPNMELWGYSEQSKLSCVRKMLQETGVRPFLLEKNKEMNAISKMKTLIYDYKRTWKLAKARDDARGCSSDVIEEWQTKLCPFYKELDPILRNHFSTTLYILSASVKSEERPVVKFESSADRNTTTFSFSTAASKLSTTTNTTEYTTTPTTTTTEKSNVATETSISSKENGESDDDASSSRSKKRRVDGNNSVNNPLERTTTATTEEQLENNDEEDEQLPGVRQLVQPRRARQSEISASWRQRELEEQQDVKPKISRITESHTQSDIVDVTELEQKKKLIKENLKIQKECKREFEHLIRKVEYELNLKLLEFDVKINQYETQLKRL